MAMIASAFHWITHRSSLDDSAIELNRQLKGYPRNHNYRVRDGTVVPCRKLRERAALISRGVPHSLGRFLDIGSCKGYFVLQAAASPTCPLAVGIDVHPPFIDVAAGVGRRLKRDKAHFHLASLARVADDPGQFGGPFRTVLLINTYHYLYWGSNLEPASLREHRVILEMLARVCAAYLVFASPLEIADCPAIIRHKARSCPTCDYSREAFEHVASDYFDVFEIGHMDRHRKRPLLLLARLGTRNGSDAGLSISSKHRLRPDVPFSALQSSRSSGLDCGERRDAHSAD